MVCIYCTYSPVEVCGFVCDRQDWLCNIVYASQRLEEHTAASGVDIGPYEFKI